MRHDLAELRDEFLVCRDAMHRWMPLNVVEEASVLRVIEKCAVCTAERTSLLSLLKRSRGHIVRRFMSHYPEGYLLPKGAGRVDVDDRGELRLYRLGY